MSKRLAPKIGNVSKRLPLVVASLSLPPPTNGQNLINASVVRGLKQMDARLKLIDTSPRSNHRTILYHLRRIAIVSSVPVILGANVAWRGRRRLYTVVEAGHGIVYNLVIVAFARLFGYALFLHHHTSNYAKVYDRRFAALCIVSGKQASHIALSEHMARDLEELYAVKTVVAHNACHIYDPGGRQHQPCNSVLTVGFLSNLSIDKGLDTVLLSFEAILASGVKARLLLGGPIVDRRVAALIKEARAKFGDAIVELGAISGATKQAFFEAIDIFLFPSRYRQEAQPLVILEALSYGVAALATPQGYSAEIVEPLGTVAEGSNFVSFTAAFARRWLCDPDFAARHRLAARARYLELSESSKFQNAHLFSLLTGA